ncbi:MAG TPA: hypothetical protein DCR37_12020 [Glaciecola sp.]|nr:hypothetical protein [Glaciecola sp.]
MNLELIVTIATAIVAANIVNKTIINPLINRFFGFGGSEGSKNTSLDGLVYVDPHAENKGKIC